MERLSRRRRIRDAALRGLLVLGGALTCAALAFVIAYVLFRGLGGVTWELLSSQRSFLRGTDGILPNILNTLYLVGLTLALALPLGVGAAVWLTEYAPPGPLAAAVSFAAETLAGIPSILYGLAGMLIFVRPLGRGVLSGALTLTFLVLPLILRTTQESLRAVPRSYREGAMGLGAGRWRTIRTVVLPGAADGVATGCILAVGRILGESAALLFTAGMGGVLNGFFRSLRSSSGTLSVALYVYAGEYADIPAAMAIAAVLMVLTLVLNLAAAWAGRRMRR